MTQNLTATPIECDVVIVSGADAAEYLQTQLTQDVVAVPRGRSAWSFILTPKSEIEALVRVTRTLDGIILDTVPGRGPAVRGRLDGLLFRMDVSFEEATWPGVAWRGDGAHEVEADAPIMAPMPWPDLEALDEIGPDVVAPTDVPVLSPDELETVRIEAIWPAEPEIGGSVTPAMTGIVEHTVNFDKGCYTGQEFVARVHYRDAAPPKRLVRVSFDEGATVEPGAEIVRDGDAVGSVTSSVPAAGVGLAYLKRSTETPCEATCGVVPIGISDRAAR
jgi:folate-binding protein YgfZ